MVLGLSFVAMGGDTYSASLMVGCYVLRRGRWEEVESNDRFLAGLDEMHIWVNRSVGPPEERMMLSGMHTVEDVFCCCCGQLLLPSRFLFLISIDTLGTCDL
ncbi:hypothetical protein SADUNF_Sadunf04G0030500 [Salix dunnii]|uniref:Yippee domain-containing protein n=1 Tax=Salix dunnii TaxID=1413687 RepID=A0A835K7U7_9ROSI|nr:hypothetical protein SADUNF_Sadunf04G0030500 [Salix dunnii]